MGYDDIGLVPRSLGNVQSRHPWQVLRYHFIIPTRREKWHFHLYQTLPHVPKKSPFLQQITFGTHFWEVYPTLKLQFYAGGNYQQVRTSYVSQPQVPPPRSNSQELPLTHEWLLEAQDPWWWWHTLLPAWGWALHMSFPWVWPQLSLLCTCSGGLALPVVCSALFDLILPISYHLYNPPVGIRSKQQQRGENA